MGLPKLIGQVESTPEPRQVSPSNPEAPPRSPPEATRRRCRLQAGEGKEAERCSLAYFASVPTSSVPIRTVINTISEELLDSASATVYYCGTAKLVEQETGENDDK